MVFLRKIRKIHPIFSRRNWCCPLKNELIQSDLINLALNDNPLDSELFDLKVKIHIFQSLELISDNLSDNFYVVYYAKLKQILREHREVNVSLTLSKVDQYLKSKSNDRFNMLLALSVCLSESMGRLNIDIFNYFSVSQWTTELLLFSLFWKCLQNTREWDIYVIQQFITKIQELDDMMMDCDVKHKIEYLLKLLILLQNEIQYDIKKMNHLLGLVSCSAESLNIILSDRYNFASMIKQLEISWFKSQCKIHDIAFTDEAIEKLKSLLFQYPVDIISCIFEKVKSKTSISELISFFSILNESDFKIISKNYFLSNCILKNTNINHWNKMLYFHLVENIIRKEFAQYDYVSVEKKTRSEKIAVYKKFVPALDDTNKNHLKKLFQYQVKREWLNIIFHDLNEALSKLMMNHNWSTNNIEILINSLDTEIKIIQLIKALEIIIEFGISDKNNKLFNIVLLSKVMDIQSNIHKAVIRLTFMGTYEKPIAQLLKELEDTNANIPGLTSYSYLLDQYKSVIKAYNSKSSLAFNDISIKIWNARDIKSWLSNKRSIDSNHHYEKIAVLYRAVEVAYGIRPRDIQLLSAILFICAKRRYRGRLAQINTGEGKTTIIAMIAAYYAIAGHKVDVVTSSPLLALPQSKQQERFYSLLGLTVSCNSNNNHSSYSADIVYGAANDFQADILREEYKKLNIRCGRKCEIAIVDEVDSMLIDGNNHIVKLSSAMPAMNHLEPILGAIYMQIDIVASSIVEKDREAFFVERRVSYENGKPKTTILKEHRINSSKADYIHKVTSEYMRILIRDCAEHSVENNPEIPIPLHLQQFIYKVQLEKWIEQAICAKFYYKNGKHYILKNGKITVVDAHNTGVIQESMHWSGGLHQFLQIKHGAKVQPESLTSNFLSNVSYFRRYSPNIYGLTGTLGSNATKDLLNKTYNVDSIIIPPFKLKQHKELTDIIVHNEHDWYYEVIKSCLLKLENGRAVLIIANYIQEIEKLKDLFVNFFNYDTSKIMVYKTNDEVEVVNQTLRAGDVLITTNIAGRGTDIKVSDAVNTNGGLHVCLTFLPLNSRVEDQNKGRTARIGNPGTSQFVLFAAKDDISCAEITNLKSKRDIQEINFSKKAQTDINIVTTKDAFFLEFCDLLNQIKGRNVETREIELMAVEERFAIWMNLNNNKIETEPKHKVFVAFKCFRDNILLDDYNNCLIKNPYLHVKIGNNYMNCKKFKEAINEYTKSIDLDPNFAENAHFYRGYALIAEYGNDINNENINKACTDFDEARKLIKKRESNLLILRCSSENDVFLQQIKNKLKLYDLQKNAIDEAIGCDISSIDKTLKDLIKVNQTNENAIERKEIANEISRLKKKKQKVGIIREAMKKKFKLTIKHIKIEESLFENEILSHKGEIDEFEKNGFIGCYEISRKINWWNVFGLCIVGVAQIIIGAVMTIFMPILSEISVPLILNGIDDIYKAVIHCIVSDDFTWKSWGIGKAIALFTTFATAGFSVAMKVMQAAVNGTKIVVTASSEFAKSQLKNIASKIGIEIFKETSKAGLVLAQHLVNETFSKAIKNKIVDTIESAMQEALVNNPMIKKMLELDKLNNNQYYENLIKKMANEILSRESTDELTDSFVTLGQTIAKLVSNSNPELDIAMSAFTPIARSLSTLNTLRTFTSKFINQLNVEINKQGETDKIDQVLNTISECNNQYKMCDTQKINKADLNISQLKDKEEQVKIEDRSIAFKALSKSLVKDVSMKMEKIIRKNIISSFTIDFGDEEIEVEKTLNVVNKFENHKKEFGITEVLEEMANMHPTDVIDLLCSKNNKDDCNVPTKQISKYLPKSLFDTLTDNTYYKSASDLYLHLAALSCVIDRSIEVYDENKVLKYLIGNDQIRNSIKIQCHKRGQNVECFALVENKGLFSEQHHLQCLNDIVAEQIGKDPDELKAMTMCIFLNDSSKVVQRKCNYIKRLDLYQSMKSFINADIQTVENIERDQKLIINTDSTIDFFQSNINGSDIDFPCRYKTGYHTKFSCTATGSTSRLYDTKGNKICLSKK